MIDADHCLITHLTFRGACYERSKFLMTTRASFEMHDVMAPKIGAHSKPCLGRISRVPSDDRQSPHFLPVYQVYIFSSSAFLLPTDAQQVTTCLIYKMLLFIHQRELFISNSESYS